MFSSPGTYEATLLALRERLTAVRYADRPRLARELDRLFARKTLDAQAHKAADALGKAIDDSVARVERLRSLPLKIEYDTALPIVAHREEIAKALQEHQLIVVCGATGSGKTTQLPKICLEAGRGTLGLIGHTQPRRIAARAIASRVASELGTSVGSCCRLPGPLHRPHRAGHAAEGDDGRHPAARAGARPAAAQLRHADHRRGPRAQPQHRLPARRAQALAAAASGAARRDHVRDHRSAALLGVLRRRADHRGVRPQLSRGSALSAADWRRRGLGAVAHGGHRCRRAGAGPRGSRRCARVPARREADPRDVRGSRQGAAARDRSAAAVLAPLDARSGADLREARYAPRRARNQRCRNVADRARHATRRRLGSRAHQPLQRAR